MRRKAAILGGLLALLSTQAQAALKAEVAAIVQMIVPIQRQIVPLRPTVRPLKAKVNAVEQAMQALKAERTQAGELKLNISADVLFAFDSAAIRPQAARTLSQVALLIREKRPRHVRIEGHTDAKGSDAYNMRLSLRRAEAVRAWLARREGIDVRLLSVKGFGERKPVAPNTNPDGSDNPDGRRLNRRVEIFLR